MRSIFIAISLAILLSCKNNKPQANFSEYLELKKKAIASTIKQDTTFLQFRFGMSITEAKDRIRHLEVDSTLYYDLAKGMYCYDIYTGRKNIDRVNCYFIPQFHNNELYSIILQARQNNDNLANRSGIAISLMKMAIGDKYGISSVSYRLNENMEETLVWFRNNVEINIHDNIEGAIIEYKDLLREQIKEHHEESKEKQASMKTQKEL